jgi:hypothetical protein
VKFNPEDLHGSLFGKPNFGYRWKKLWALYMKTYLIIMLLATLKLKKKRTLQLKQYHAVSLPARSSVLPSVYFCLSGRLFVRLSSGISTAPVGWI